MLIVTIAMTSEIRKQKSTDKMKDGLQAPDRKRKKEAENKFMVHTPCIPVGWKQSGNTEKEKTL